MKRRLGRDELRDQPKNDGKEETDHRPLRTKKQQLERDKENLLSIFDKIINFLWCDILFNEKKENVIIERCLFIYT